MVAPYTPSPAAPCPCAPSSNIWRVTSGVYMTAYFSDTDATVAPPPADTFAVTVTTSLSPGSCGPCATCEICGPCESGALLACPGVGSRKNDAGGTTGGVT